MLFDRLAAAYATQWLAKWEGMNIDMVKSVWQDELDRITVRQVKYALANLPRDFPPNAMQFRDLCKQAPDPPVAMIRDASRKQDPKRLAEILAKLPRFVNPDPLSCARMHLARLRAGEKLTQNQIDLVRAALPHELTKESNGRTNH